MCALSRRRLEADLLALQVWKKFLFPPWAKESDGPVKELDFKEDDGKALLILLRIVHFQFVKIPVAFRASIKPLYNIAILCEQYDCVSITKPWSKEWCLRLRDVRLPLLAGDTRRKAYIAWAFGLPETFRGLAKTLVEKCRVQANGTLEDDEAILPDKLLGMYSTQDFVGVETMLTRLPESIQAIREHTLQKILDIPYDHLDQCTSGGSACGDERCTALVYGSLLLELGRCGLWPKKTAAEIKDSISTIADLILDLKVLYPKVELQTTGDLHTMITEENKHFNCPVQYRSTVQAIMAAVPNPTLECHIRHMQLRSGSATVEELAAAPYATRYEDVSDISSEPPKKRLEVETSSLSSSSTSFQDFIRRCRPNSSLLGQGPRSASSRPSPIPPPQAPLSWRCGTAHFSFTGCEKTAVRGTKRRLS